MKEMKLMRELRHDNVNSFIGACVDMPDPTDQSTITLITEYCAKGALNDIPGEQGHQARCHVSLVINS